MNDQTQKYTKYVPANQITIDKKALNTIVTPAQLSLLIQSLCHF